MLLLLLLNEVVVLIVALIHGLMPFVAVVVVEILSLIIDEMETKYHLVFAF